MTAQHEDIKQQHETAQKERDDAKAQLEESEKEKEQLKADKADLEAKNKEQEDKIAEVEQTNKEQDEKIKELEAAAAIAGTVFTYIFLLPDYFALYLCDHCSCRRHRCCCRDR